MDIRYRFSNGLLAVAVAAILSQAARAQPAGAPGDDDASAAAAPAAEPQPNAPGVDAILATNPTTPAERVRAERGPAGSGRRGAPQRVRR